MDKERYPSIYQCQRSGLRVLSDTPGRLSELPIFELRDRNPNSIDIEFDIELTEAVTKIERARI
jgi:hypothetical protein